jgi:hypothetical protein
MDTFFSMAFFRNLWHKNRLSDHISANSVCHNCVIIAKDRYLCKQLLSGHIFRCSSIITLTGSRRIFFSSCCELLQLIDSAEQFSVASFMRRILYSRETVGQGYFNSKVFFSCTRMFMFMLLYCEISMKMYLQYHKHRMR